ncbi:hypothetical protein FPOAC2_02861 [Fusarium poae]|jgi:hypothetical protein
MQDVRPESSRGNVYGTHPEDKRRKLRFRPERRMTYRATETKLGAKHCFWVHAPGRENATRLLQTTGSTAYGDRDGIAGYDTARYWMEAVTTTTTNTLFH